MHAEVFDNLRRFRFRRFRAHILHGSDQIDPFLACIMRLYNRLQPMTDGARLQQHLPAFARRHGLRAQRDTPRGTGEGQYTARGDVAAFHARSVCWIPTAPAPSASSAASAAAATTQRTRKQMEPGATIGTGAVRSRLRINPLSQRNAANVDRTAPSMVIS